MNIMTMPVRRTMCATCPFRARSKTAFVIPQLLETMFSTASRICHSTGSNNAFNEETGLPGYLCRGARDVQLQFFYDLKFIDAATDEAWNRKRVDMGMPPVPVRDPSRRK
jgi:hypothetical protein